MTTMRELIAREVVYASSEQSRRVTFLAELTQALAKGLERSTPTVGWVCPPKGAMLSLYGFFIDTIEAAGLEVEDKGEILRIHGKIRMKVNYQFVEVPIDCEFRTVLYQEGNRPDNRIWIVPKEHFAEVRKICEFLFNAVNGIDLSFYPHLLEAVGLNPSEILKTETAEVDA